MAKYFIDWWVQNYFFMMEIVLNFGPTTIKKHVCSSEKKGKNFWLACWEIPKYFFGNSSHCITVKTVKHGSLKIMLKKYFVVLLLFPCSQMYMCINYIHIFMQIHSIITLFKADAWTFVQMHNLRLRLLFLSHLK